MNAPIHHGPDYGTGRYITPLGYALVSDAAHPNANAQGKVFEHTKVMSEILGRPLRKGETVHHKNGNRKDNRRENLELWLRQPPGQRIQDLVSWAEGIVARYAEEAARLTSAH